MALAVAIGNRIDMDVRGFGNPPPPQCPDKVFVLQVCNSNSLIDDNFDVFLNGTLIGALDLNQNAQVGSVFIGSTDTRQNTIFIDNTQNNGNCNRGTFEIRNYEIDPNNPNELSNPCVIDDQEYIGGSGVDFTLTFDYTECCP